MALDKQPYKLPLAQGMNTKKDPKTLTGGLTLVQNAVYRKDEEVQKRLGWTSLEKTIGGGGTIASADAAATYGQELLIWSVNKLYTWSDAQKKWYNRGAAYSAAVDTRQIISSVTNYGITDSAQGGGLVVVAYELGVTVHYQVYDYVTGAVVRGDVDVAGGISQRPKCVSISNGLFIFYSDTSNTIRGAIINMATGDVQTTVTVANGDLSLISSWDVIAIASDTIMLTYANTSSNITVKYLNSSLGPRGGTYVDSNTATGSPNLIRLIPLTGGQALIAYQGSATNIQARIVSATGTVGTAIDSGLNKVVATLSASQLSGHLSAGTKCVIYVQYTAAVESNNFIYKITINVPGSVTDGSSLFMRSVGLVSRGFLYNGIGFVGIFHNSNLQATFFVVDESGVVVSRHQPGKGGQGAANNSVSSVWSVASGRYNFSILNKTRLIATTDTLALYQFAGSSTPNGANIYSPFNVALTSIDFQNNSNFTAAELGESLLIVGGAVSMYDGLSVVEHGFFLFPEGVTASAGGVGSVGDGTYLVCVCYEWSDAKGLTHRSAPSIPASVTVSGGPKQISAVVPTLRITQKKAPRANVTLVMYRTQASQTGPFYRTSSVTAPTENDPLVDSLTLVDQLADASLPGRDILYTSGGILDNAAAYPAKYMSVWRGRIMLTGGEQNTVQFSKPIVAGAPVEFAAENMLDFESDGGPATALEILDEKLILFKGEWAYYTFGDGPDALGLGGLFSPFERIANMDVGCQDQQSTCPVPGGVIFKSLRGYCSLDRNLGTQYIGAEIEDYNALSVSSATLFANQNEIRITNSNGVALVYNYYYNRWGVFTNYDAVDGLRWRGRFLHVKSDGRVCLENAAICRDDGVNYNVKMTTGWQTLADIAGFQRIYRGQVNGAYKTPVGLTMRVAYDFDETGWYGAGSIALSAAGYSFQFDPPIQKCEAIRFELECEVTEIVTEGQGINLNSYTLMLGIKRGLSKLSPAQRQAISAP